jgi:hypothetical protein
VERFVVCTVGPVTSTDGRVCTRYPVEASTRNAPLHCWLPSGEGSSRWLEARVRFRSLLIRGSGVRSPAVTASEEREYRRTLVVSLLITTDEMTAGRIDQPKVRIARLINFINFAELIWLSARQVLGEYNTARGPGVSMSSIFRPATQVGLYRSD